MAIGFAGCVNEVLGIAEEQSSSFTRFPLSEGHWHSTRGQSPRPAPPGGTPRDGPPSFLSAAKGGSNILPGTVFTAVLAPVHARSELCSSCNIVLSAKMLGALDLSGARQYTSQACDPCEARPPSEAPAEVV
jgi:hypothetical protein